MQSYLGFSYVKNKLANIVLILTSAPLLILWISTLVDLQLSHAHLPLYTKIAKIKTYFRSGGAVSQKIGSHLGFRK